MSNLILYDDDTWAQLRPLSYNKPVAEIYIGIGTIRRKWESALGLEASYITQDHLAELFPTNIKEDNFLINGSVIPSPQLVHLVKNLKINEALLDKDDELIAARFPAHQFTLLAEEKPIEELTGYTLKDTQFIKINNITDLLTTLEQVISFDVHRLDSSEYSQKIPAEWTKTKENIYIHKTARIDQSYLDSSNGPICIGPNVQLLAGTKITGPCYLGAESVTKMNAVIYGPFSCGPSCVLGGEVKSSIFQNHSSKGHFGYIGNSVIGSFCNLGAGTSASNLKNTLTNVHLWDYKYEKFVDTGCLKLGLIMGDFSKTAIHTAFNTGTMIGVCCNIYSKGFPRKFIPSFSWGGSSGYINYELEKALSVASASKGLKYLEMKESEKNMLAAIYKISEKFRGSYN